MSRTTCCSGGQSWGSARGCWTPTAWALWVNRTSLSPGHCCPCHGQKSPRADTWCSLAGGSWHRVARDCVRGHTAGLSGAKVQAQVHQATSPEGLGTWETNCETVALGLESLPGIDLGRKPKAKEESPQCAVSGAPGWPPKGRGQLLPGHSSGAPFQGPAGDSALTSSQAGGVPLLPFFLLHTPPSALPSSQLCPGSRPSGPAGHRPWAETPGSFSQA